MLPSPADVSYRKTWILESISLLIGMIAITWLFWTTDLDVQVSWRFFDALNETNHWPQESLSLWQFFYKGAPWITALTGLAGLGMIVGSLFRRGKRIWRAYGAFIILSVLLGPGLLINAVFKDHWNRPRPRNIEQFGGTLPYVAPLKIGPEGKSFPCGHCSVGFVTVVFYFLLRRRHRILAPIALGLAFGLGLLMGYARMVAGAHYFSDVLWSCFITVAAVMLSYYGITRIPLREEEPERFAGASSSNTPRTLSKRVRWAFGLGGLALLLMLPVVFFIPFEQHASSVFSVETIGRQPNELLLEVSEGDLTLNLQTSGAVISNEEQIKGFGFPGSKLKLYTVANTSEGFYHLLWKPKGLPTEIEGGIIATVNCSQIKRIHLRVPKGVVIIDGKLLASQCPDILVECPTLHIGADLPQEKIQTSAR